MSIEPISISSVLQKVEASLDDPGECCTEQIRAAISIVVDEINYRFAFL